MGTCCCDDSGSSSDDQQRPLNKKGKKKTKKGFGMSDIFCCWYDLYKGSACWLYNCIFCPFMLLIHSIRVYFCGCFWIHFQRSFWWICCWPCRMCKCCFAFTDKSFPPKQKSLGAVAGDSAAVGIRTSQRNSQSPGRNSVGVKSQKDQYKKEAQGTTIWIRGSELMKPKNWRNKSFSGKQKKKQKMHLFYQGVEADDVCQGALGDCWLLSAMACLAEEKCGIERLFDTREIDPRGKYKVTLFDGTKNKCKGEWVDIVIDDFIPCDRNAWINQRIAKPKFSKPHGNELWVLLLEKAFAKLCGSYAELEGGSTLWALRAMTGDHARWFTIDTTKKEWTRWDLRSTNEKNSNGKANKRACELIQYRKNDGKPEVFGKEKMWTVVKRYLQRKSVLCASGASGIAGLVSGHAYSILEYYEKDNIKLVQIRNPWGSGEWLGDWGRGSILWNKHPKLKKELYRGKDDGLFWMSWKDFCLHWERIGVIDRTVDIGQLVIEIDSKDHDCSTRWCSPTKACMTGCCKFWCGCNGCLRLYCPKKSSTKTISTKQHCCDEHVFKVDQRY